VRFYSRDMPLDFHPDAMRAAEAARCASDQGQFWRLRDVMGANPNKLDMDSLVADVTKLEDGREGIPRLRGKRKVQERRADRRHGSHEDRRQRDAHVRGR